MRWWPHDVGTWSLYIGIAALLLAFPLGIASNLMAPKVQNWWALRSIASLKKRIEKLEKRLAEVEATPLYSNFEWVAMRGIARIGWLVLSTEELFLIIVIAVLGSLTTDAAVGIPRSMVLILLLGYGGLMFKHTMARQMFHEAVIEGTERGRAEMRATIAKLKEQLAEKEPAPRAFQ